MRKTCMSGVLRKKENVAVILLGGEMNHRGHCHDFYTIQMVKSIRIDKAFLSHTGLTVDFGASIHNSAGVTDDKVSDDFIQQMDELGINIEVTKVEG